MHQRLLLGEDHDEYGIATTVAIGGRSAASISVGADRGSPGLQFKGDGAVPNEDALCVLDTGDRVLLAVADAHFGHESSHTLIDGLHSAAAAALPTTERDLVATVAKLGEGPTPTTGSESTLLVALFDRSTGRGLAISFGDSTLARVTATGEYRRLNRKNHRYVARGTLWPVDGFSVGNFEAGEGDTLLMFTDGVDECHYRNAATSVRPVHIVDAVNQAGGQPRRTSELLVGLALAGVDGHPGGQDNIALIVTQA